MVVGGWEIFECKEKRDGRYNLRLGDGVIFFLIFFVFSISLIVNFINERIVRRFLL